MKSVMRMKDLKAKDGFPKDIDRKHTVVIQIPFPNIVKMPDIFGGLPVIIYTVKNTGDAGRDVLPSLLAYKYKPGLYIIKPDV